MIVHLLAIDIATPGTTELLFSALFEICSFDFLPTDSLYETIFAFDNVPVND